MIKAVIFDLDGVIINSEEAHVTAEKTVLAKYDLVIEDHDWSTFKGKTAAGMFQGIVEKYGVQHVSAEELVAEKEKLLSLIVSEAALFTGFQELIAALRSIYKIGLTTSSSEPLQEAIFNKFALHPWFDAVVHAGMVTKGKPHPEPYLLTMHKLGVQPADCIVIEDADNGVTSAKKAGATVIAVTHSLPKEALAHADYVVDSLQEVGECVERIRQDY